MTTEKNKILLEVDGFKLHTMVADGKKAKKKHTKRKSSGLHIVNFGFGATIRTH